jgi:hypothetical protein
VAELNHAWVLVDLNRIIAGFMVQGYPEQ